MKLPPSVSKRHAWASHLRRAGILLCLVVAGCSGSKLPSGPTALRAADSAAPAPSAAVAAPVTPVTTAPLSASSQSSPSQTSSAQAPSSQAAPSQVASSQPSSPPLSESDRVLQARADCWMRVERERRMRDIDRRVAYVEKCVAGELNGKP
jgi:hypothetical protein